MDLNKGFGVSFDPNHENHIFALGCSACEAENFPGDSCVEFEITPGVSVMKCNHLLTVLDAEGRMQHILIRPDKHEDWHKVMEQSKVSSPQDFDDLLCAYFGL